MSFARFVQDFSDKKVLVFGLGVLGGGSGVVKTLIEANAHIRITDLKSEIQLQKVLSSFDRSKVEKMTLAHHSKDDIEWADVIIKNPAVPLDNEYIIYSKKLNKHLSSEAVLFLKYTKTKSIGVTGTRGKTTTTQMIHYLIKNLLDPHAIIGGNINEIGTLSLLRDESKAEYSVIELSSFALDLAESEQRSPNLAVITNLFPDHLNRYHQQMQKYAEAKKSICLYQKAEDHLFLNQDNQWSSFFAQDILSTVHYIDPQKTSDITLSIPGRHNQLNAAFAVEVVNTLGVESSKAIECIKKFSGVPFRLQMIAQNSFLRFFNDSTSTTPEALIAALETIPTATFIIGGTTKQLDLKNLAQKLNQFKGNLVLLAGSGSTQLNDLLEKKLTLYNSLQSAFKQALELTPTGTIVFSPGFSSFEMFVNEFDRAEQFNHLVSEYLTK